MRQYKKNAILFPFLLFFKEQRLPIRLKILIVTPRIPFPPFRGDKLKIFNICRILIRKNDVKILTFISKTSEEKDLSELRTNDIDAEAIPLHKLKSLINLLRSFVSKEPLQVSYYYSKKMRKRIYELTSEQKYDVVYFHLINTAQYFDAVANPETLKVNDFTDATSLYLTRYLEFLKNPFRKIVFNLELQRVLEYEKITQKFDTLFVCSNVDKEFLLKRNIHNNIQILLNGIDLDSFQYEKVEPQKWRIIFSGNMSYFPNIDAVKYFVKEIFPMVLAKVPEAKFYVVGQQPPKEILELQKNNIIVTGFVKDIRKEYLSSEVNVAPIRFGSGTLNKIIESLVLGIPTIATNTSINGFPNELKKYVLTADTPKEFAKTIVKVLEDKSIINSFRREAMQNITQMLSWEKIVLDFENYLFDRMSKK